MLRAVLVLVVLTACGTRTVKPQPITSPRKYDQARDPVIGPISIQAAGAFIAEACRNGSPLMRPTGNAPSKHMIDVGSAKIEQPCGLIFNEIFEAAYLTNFAQKVCGLTDEKLTDACSKRFIETYMARLAERYTGADWRAVNQRCTAYPIECQEEGALERMLLASHNESVQAWYYKAVELARANAYRAQADVQAAEAGAQERREEDRREKARAIGAALEGLGKAIAPPTTRCTSTTVGNSTYTNCR